MKILIVRTKRRKSPVPIRWNVSCSQRRDCFGSDIIKPRLEYCRGPVPLERNLTRMTKKRRFSKRVTR